MKSWREIYKAGKEVRDWSTDGCSAAPDKFFDVNLHECCAEHDFYYRNDVGVKRFKADNRLRKCIANKIINKLHKEGTPYFIAYVKGWSLAAIYFTGVRVGGGNAYRKNHGFIDKWVDEESEI